MTDARPITILCLASYEKGQEFLRECKRQGARVLLLTIENLKDAAWPRESIDDVLYKREEAAPDTSIVYGLVEE